VQLRLRFDFHGRDGGDSYIGLRGLIVHFIVELFALYATVDYTITMITVKELAWLGGLLEGEASFMLRNGCHKIALQMTDLDVVQRAAAILGVPVGAYSRQPKGKATYLPVWHLAVHGIKAIAWMMTLYTLMGERRKAKILEVLDHWKASKSAPRASRGTRLMAVCHPDRPRAAHMLCNTCWMREYRKRTGKNGNYYRKQKLIPEPV